MNKEWKWISILIVVITGCNAMVEDLTRGGNPPSSEEQETDCPDSDCILSRDIDVGSDTHADDISDPSSERDTDTDVDTEIATDTDPETDTDCDVDGGNTDSDSDGDTDADTDADLDMTTDTHSDAGTDTTRSTESDSETPVEPTIFMIEGTGSEQKVSPHPDDLAAWESYESTRIAASRRINSAEKQLVITGENLLDITTAMAVGQNSQGTIEFEIEETTMNKLTLKFPTVMTVASGGLFILTLSTATSSVDAQVFFLQGEKGDPGDKGDQGDKGAPGTPGEKGDPGDGFDCDGKTCTIPVNQNLVVNGDIRGTNVTLNGNLNAMNGIFSGDLDVNGDATVDTLTVETSYWLPECPEGYERDNTASDRISCKKGLDEMVKVGNFWIDRYEVSIWGNPDCTGSRYGSDSEDYHDTFPDTGNWTRQLFACSVPGVIPSGYMTWFQAQQSCEAAGKYLCSNAEWQVAAAGTYDPGATGQGSQCLISGTEPRATGGAGDSPGDWTSCISIWGAEDMIGNLWEWTSDWWGQGSDDQYQQQESAFGQDGTWNVDPAEYQECYPGNSLPAAGLRGGGWAEYARAGVFALSLHHGPSDSRSSFGARCCRQK